MFKTMSEIIKSMPPQVGILMLKPLLELADFPGRDELIAQLMQMLNMPQENTQSSATEQGGLGNEGQGQAALGIPGAAGAGAGGGAVPIQ
jgi:hypothetical protein